MLFFNQNHGYLEGLVRGFKNGLLNQSEYQDFVQNHYFLWKIFSVFVKFFDFHKITDKTFLSTQSNKMVTRGDREPYSKVFESFRLPDIFRIFEKSFFWQFELTFWSKNRYFFIEILKIRDFLGDFFT